MGSLIGRLSAQVGRINLNCQCRRGPDTLPFAGRKDSGQTVLSVNDTIRKFSTPSLVTALSDLEDYRLMRSTVFGGRSDPLCAMDMP